MTNIQSKTKYCNRKKNKSEGISFARFFKIIIHHFLLSFPKFSVLANFALSYKISLFKILTYIIDALSPLNPYAFPAQLTLIPRSVETFSMELRRISETSGMVIYSCLILIRYIVKSYFYSKRSRWGEIPRFTGKSPP